MKTKINLLIKHDLHPKIGLASCKNVINAMQEYADQQTKELREEIDRLKERIQHLTPIDDDYYNH